MTGKSIVLKPSEITPLTATGWLPSWCCQDRQRLWYAVTSCLLTVLLREIQVLQLDKPSVSTWSLKMLPSWEALWQPAKSSDHLQEVTSGSSRSCLVESPTITFDGAGIDDMDIDEAVKGASHGILWVWWTLVLMGLTTRSLTQANQCCTAGSRICIQEGIYDEFLRK